MNGLEEEEKQMKWRRRRLQREEGWTISILVNSDQSVV
jgi:hypothetical protein